MAKNGLLVVQQWQQQETSNTCKTKRFQNTGS